VGRRVSGRRPPLPAPGYEIEDPGYDEGREPAYEGPDELVCLYGHGPVAQETGKAKNRAAARKRAQARRKAALRRAQARRQAARKRAAAERQRLKAKKAGRGQSR
jgi:hypothetical protein